MQSAPTIAHGAQCARVSGESVPIGPMIRALAKGEHGYEFEPPGSALAPASLSTKTKGPIRTQDALNA